jgi:hypothetical protein
VVVKFFTDENGFATTKRPKKGKVQTTQLKREPIPIQYYANDIELSMDGGKRYTMIFDIESFTNYFLIGFYCVESKKYVIFEDCPGEKINLAKLQWVIDNFRLVGFNSKTFDLPLVMLALRGYNCEMLKYYTNKIINEELSSYQIENDLKIYVPQTIAHIDIMPVCPLQGSLKKYSARLHAKRLQDLPYEPERILSYDEAQYVKNYCLGADIPNTLLIFEQLSEQIRLRYDLTAKYGTDLLSKSDAQIAEAAIKAEYRRRTGKTAKRDTIGQGTSFQYVPPAYLKFDSPLMKQNFALIQAMQFYITEEGKVSMPDELKAMEMQIGNTFYKMGKGGLHSKEKCASYKAENGMILCDIDVESFYPRLILNSGLYPESIGPVFLEIFNEIVERRLFAKGEAKRLKEELKKINDQLGAIHKDLQFTIDGYQVEADGLKITINGTFGKLGSRWSVMYAPNLLIQVTITGQLSLLMLIERMHANGIQVVSANTDGIVLYMHESQYAQAMAIKDQWCKEAGLKMDETRYKALYSRDVNNYIAVKMDNKVKFKGSYSNPWNDKDLAVFRFHKNPMTTVCIEAVEKLLTVGTPVEQTIFDCQDITKFVCTRDVAGGAHKDGVFLGKMIRFYYANDTTGTINYINEGKKVGESESGKPLMDLPDTLPDDINYSKYVDKCNEMLYAIGYYRRPETASLFD